MANERFFNTFIGIDVSKDSLDIYSSTTGECWHIQNDEESLNTLVEKMPFSSETLVIIDLTGGYEARCVEAFHRFGFAVIRAEGRKVKAFAKAMAFNAKTDKLDAQLLALYGEKCYEKLHLYQPNQAFKLRKIHERLQDMKDFLQREKNRAQGPDIIAPVVSSIQNVLTTLEKEIADLTKQLDEVIRNDTYLSEKFHVLIEETGVGKMTAYQILALLPELGHVNRRIIASLAGVAPHARDSGKQKGYRYVHGGRKMIKKGLFIAALSASRYHEKLRVFYERLLSQGKPKLVALVAVMRKLLLILNARCKEWLEKNLSATHAMG